MLEQRTKEGGRVMIRVREKRASGVWLLLVGFGLGLAVAAGGGAVVPKDLDGVERLVVKGEEGQEVILGKIDEKRFGVLVRDAKANADVFLGIEERDGERVARCVTRGGEGHEAEMMASRRLVEFLAKGGAGRKSSGVAMLKTNGRETSLLLEGPASTGIADRSSLGWSSRDGVLALAAWKEGTEKRWERRIEPIPEGGKGETSD